MRCPIVVSAAVLAAGLAFAQTPKVAANGVVNAATFSKGDPVAPGSLMSIFGTGLAAKTAIADSVPFSTTLGGVSVKLVNGNQSFEAPVSYVQPESGQTAAQINAQVPWNTNPGNAPVTYTLTVTNNGVQSAPVPITVGPFSPGIFAFNGQRAIVANLDGTFAWPAGAVAGAKSRPAKPGDAVVIYATGLGAVDTPIGDGHDSLDKLRHTLVKPVVLIGGISAEVLFSGLTPQFPGVNQINVLVPSNVAASDSVPIQLQLGGITTPSKITMAVGP